MPRGRGGSDNGSENQEQVGTFETLRDEGEHFVHVKQYQKAIESFTRALEMKADDKNCLVTRSKCWLQLGNAENALTDAQVALDQDKEFIRGLFQKAEALYQMGDFETALVFYHRGHRLRPELQEFRLGIQKCQEAINNSIGTPSSVKLEAKGDLSFFYKQEEAKKQGQKGYQKPGQKKEVKKEREKPGRGAGDSKTIKQLLGELYGDKEYLEKLNKDESLMGNRNDMSKDIKDRVCDGLDYLYSRADFWRQQKPMYARKRDKDRIHRSTPSRGRVSPDKILKFLEEIDEAQARGEYEESLQKARQTLKVVESYPDDELQNKQELLANIFSCMGNAYLEMEKFNQAMEFHERDWKIAVENDLEDAKSRALDNRGRVHARRKEYKEAIDVWEEKLPMSKSPLESTWLYHEIGRCYLELGNFNKARDYGEKSLAAAKESDDQGWQLHANVLVAQSEVKLGDYQAAADSFEKSLEMAKKQDDKDAENAIKRALEEVNVRIVKGVKDDDDQDDERRHRTVKAVTEVEYEDDFEVAQDAHIEEQPRPKSVSIKEPEKEELPRPKSVSIKEPEKEESPRPKSVSVKDEFQGPGSVRRPTDTPTSQKSMGREKSPIQSRGATPVGPGVQSPPKSPGTGTPRTKSGKSVRIAVEEEPLKQSPLPQTQVEVEGEETERPRSTGGDDDTTSENIKVTDDKEETTSENRKVIPEGKKHKGGDDDNRKVDEHPRATSPGGRKHKGDDTTSDDNVKVTDDSPRATSPGGRKHKGGDSDQEHPGKGKALGRHKNDDDDDTGNRKVEP